MKKEDVSYIKEEFSHLIVTFREVWKRAVFGAIHCYE